MSTREPPIGFADRVGGANDDLAIGSRPDACPPSHVAHLVVARAEFHTVFTHFPSPLATGISKGISPYQSPMGGTFSVSLATPSHRRASKGVGAP